MNSLTVVRNIFLLVFGLCVVAVGTERTTQLVLEMRRTDKSQDARIDELELQLRDLRVTGVKAADPPNADDVVHAIPIAGMAQRGPADARVTIVAFLDYQCPFCGRAYETIAQLLRQSADVRLVVAHNPLPFHDQAMSAALVAECAHAHYRRKVDFADDSAFWAMHAELFTRQRVLADVIAEAKLHDAGVASCMDDPHMRRVIEEHQAIAKREGAMGTPTFFINGRRLVGAQPIERFQEAVDRARSEVNASGIAPARYYNEVVLAKAR